MAEIDWAVMDDVVSSSSILSGVTAGATTPPNGGGTFFFGFNSLVADLGVAGRYVDLTNFNPYVKGISVRAALKRGVSAGVTGFAPMLWAGIQSNPPSVNDPGYLLFLSDDEPHSIVLKKGAPSGAMEAVGSGVLAVSSATYLADTWLHLRMDVIANPNGDVVINVFQSDLNLHAVTTPTWDAIPGMAQVIDDSLRVLTGSDPLTGGFAGFAFQSAALNRRSYVDHFAVQRQI